MRQIAVIGAIAAALCACQSFPASGPAATAAAGSSAEATPVPWAKPVPLPLLGSQSGETVTAFVPPYGLVRATRETMANLGKPLESPYKTTELVAACRDMVKTEAVKRGARDVEAVAAGPERRLRGGRVSGPVRLRITYSRPDVYEVREATMTCVVDNTGRVVDTSA